MDGSILSYMIFRLCSCFRLTFVEMGDYVYIYIWMYGYMDISMLDIFLHPPAAKPTHQAANGNRMH